MLLQIWVIEESAVTRVDSVAKQPELVERESREIRFKQSAALRHCSFNHVKDPVNL